MTYKPLYPEPHKDIKRRLDALEEAVFPSKAPVSSLTARTEQTEQTATPGGHDMETRENETQSVSGESPTLLPCPFGCPLEGEPGVRRGPPMVCEDEEGGYEVMCWAGCTGPWGETPLEASEHWNTRAEPAPSEETWAGGELLHAEEPENHVPGWGGVCVSKHVFRHGEDGTCAVCTGERGDAMHFTDTMRPAPPAEPGDADDFLTVNSLLQHVKDAEAARAAALARVEELERESVLYKDGYVSACGTVADMHAAAVGEIRGPDRGVVEDVTDLRAALASMTEERGRLEDIIGVGKVRYIKKLDDVLAVRAADLTAAWERVAELEGQTNDAEQRSLKHYLKITDLKAENARLRDGWRAASDEARGLREALEKARDELGVPTPEYPAPVANAVEIIVAALAQEGE